MPVAMADTAVADEPVTGDGVAETVITPDERSETVLYSNITLVLLAFAFTLPFKVEENAVVPVAALVVTVGATGAFTVAFVVLVPVTAQLFASVTVSVYTPDAAVVAEVMVGLALVDANELGPTHEYVYGVLPPETEDVRLRFAPAIIGPLLLTDVSINAEGSVIGVTPVKVAPPVSVIV